MLLYYCDILHIIDPLAVLFADFCDSVHKIRTGAKILFTMVLPIVISA